MSIGNAALRRILHDDSGQDTVEFALLASLISVAGIAAIKSLGPLLFRLYAKVMAGVALAGGRG
jgi:Flp pilus assembly pilin Flp